MPPTPTFPTSQINPRRQDPEPSDPRLSNSQQNPSHQMPDHQIHSMGRADLTEAGTIDSIFQIFSQPYLHWQKTIESPGYS